MRLILVGQGGVLLVLCLLLPQTVHSAPRAFVHAHIIPIRGEAIADGVLVVDDGKIVAVGAADSTPIPEDAELVDATGRVIMPGLICTHSHIGGIGAADGSGPIQPGVRSLRFAQRTRFGVQASPGRRPDDAEHHAGLRAPDQRPDHVRQAAFYQGLGRTIDDLFLRRRRRSAAGRAEDGQRHQLHPVRAVAGHTRQIGLPGPRTISQGSRVPGQAGSCRRRRIEQAAAA